MSEIEYVWLLQTHQSDEVVDNGIYSNQEIAEKAYDRLIQSLKDESKDLLSYLEWVGVGTENNEPYTKYFRVDNDILIMLRKIELNVDFNCHWEISYE